MRALGHLDVFVPVAVQALDRPSFVPLVAQALGRPKESHVFARVLRRPPVPWRKVIQRNVLENNSHYSCQLDQKRAVPSKLRDCKVLSFWMTCFCLHLEDGVCPFHRCCRIFCLCPFSSRPCSSLHSIFVDLPCTERFASRMRAYWIAAPVALPTTGSVR